MRSKPETIANVSVKEYCFSKKQIQGIVEASQFKWTFKYSFNKGLLKVNPPLGRALIEDALLRFLLKKDYDLEINSIEEVLKNYNKKKEYNFYKDIKKISESKRSEIFRRLNSTQHGTINLVRLREKLLELLDKHPNFRKIDFDLSSLFKDWFNRGFLILKPIDWETPANILEKIIEYIL